MPSSPPTRRRGRQRRVRRSCTSGAASTPWMPSGRAGSCPSPIMSGWRRPSTTSTRPRRPGTTRSGRPPGICNPPTRSSTTRKPSPLQDLIQRLRPRPGMSSWPPATPSQSKDMPLIGLGVKDTWGTGRFWMDSLVQQIERDWTCFAGRHRRGELHRRPICDLLRALAGVGRRTTASRTMSPHSTCTPGSSSFPRAKQG